MISRDERENYDKRITRLEKFRSDVDNLQTSIWKEFTLSSIRNRSDYDIDYQAGEMIYDKLEYLLYDIDKEIDYIASERDYAQEAAS